jgi:hypothetical protein
MHCRAALAQFVLCAGAVVAGSATSAATENYSLKLGEATSLASGGRVTFIHAVDDRCPSDVVCISPGSLYALLWLELGAKKSLVAVSWPSQRADIELSNKAYGIEFCFLSLEPKRRQAGPAPREQLVLSVLVRSSSTSNSACPA